ncbi:MAG: hypothetical protein MUO76_18970 [Anaerolineaceae bacterium]|nr:hypothetical protein [Anaerolineaceae bacterium]
MRMRTLGTGVVMILAFSVSACSLPFSTRPITPTLAHLAGLTAITPTGTTEPTHLPAATETITPTLSPSGTIISTLTPTQTATPTLSPSATSTATPTITPTYAILRGRVIPEHLNCRYGPGVMYLYKYGLLGGSNLEIIGRTDLGIWILIQAIGGNNPCWVNAAMMEIQGDVMSVAPVDPHIVLAWSPYYGALTGVSAIRDGDEVTVFWDPLPMRAGDDSEQIPYVLEAWVCVDGQIVFTPIGVYYIAAKVSDELGCAEPSHARVLAAEKHGYTPWIKVPWPAHDAAQTATP